MLTILLGCLIFLRLPETISHSLPNKYCDEKCGDLKIPFPFHLNSSCASLTSDSFRLYCANTTALYLNTTGVIPQNLRVLGFFSDGVLVDLFSAASSSSTCRQYSDLNSFSFEGGSYLGVSDENVIGLYDCEDSSVCRAECEAVTLPGCGGRGGGGSPPPACCYPLSDHSVWRFGDGLSVFSKFGCRGFSSWAVPRAATAGRRGVKLEWAVPAPVNTSESSTVCARGSRVVNSTAVKGGVRCLCQEGFVGDGFSMGNGCVQSCIKDTREVYGSECNKQKHNDKKLIAIGVVLSSAFIAASFAALFCLLRQSAGNKPGEFFVDSTISPRNYYAFRSTRLFARRELEKATGGFGEDHQLSRGSNGTTYSGVLSDGSHVAVHRPSLADETVLSRIDRLSSVRHRNLSRLLGVCAAPPPPPLVVYDRPPGGATLEERLDRSGRDHPGVLGWGERLDIAVETAGVLKFLHREVSPPIFHGDLRSGSIFVDENSSAKIFLLGVMSGASLGESDDVCGMGMLLVEIISGSKRPVMELVSKMKSSGRVEEIVDPVLLYDDGWSSCRREQVEKVAELASRCLLFGGGGNFGMVDVWRELGHIAKQPAKKGPALEETFSNSSLLQMISMSPDSIYNHLH